MAAATREDQGGPLISAGNPRDGDGKATAGSIHRWSAGHPHYDYGVGVAHGSNFTWLMSGMPILFTYTLSFANVGIFRNNHHPMLHRMERISGGVPWANLLLLFWMVAGTHCDWVDGGDSFRGDVHGGVRRGFGHGSSFLHIFDANDHIACNGPTCVRGLPGLQRDSELGEQCTSALAQG